MAESSSIEIDVSGEAADSEKRRIRKEKAIETATAVLLGVTTLLTAWATWIGSLHEGLEQIHFTESNNTTTRAIALYGDATQMVVQDAAVWGSYQNYFLDAQAATAEGNDLELRAATAKLEALEEMCSPELRSAIDWALETGKSPFEMEGYAQSYYEEAKNLVEESQNIMATGKQDNMNSDKFGLVSVIYSLVLFLLGIAGTFKRSPNRMLIMGTAVALLVAGFAFMLSIPMPEGFNLLDYLGAK